ncbi:30S ribosomal protein S13 [Candidatus Bipolaricaulota bacterium]|nr:30S ribosomal protein S13 [Candidatus Bipolaricaulota bacterium]
MARIAGVDLPKDKHVVIGLQYIFGIGATSSAKILERAGVPFDVKVRDLSEEQATKIRGVMDRDFIVEGDLRREVQFSVRRLIEIGSVRGMRHRRNLPVNGQRTKTNARTRRGTRKTVAGRGQRRGASKK